MNEGIRINKYLSLAGVCSRRKADLLISEGRVRIDGVISENGSKVYGGQRVTLDGRDIEIQEDKVVIALNKPVGIVCTSSKKDKNNIIDYVNYPKRIFSIGRLDKDSEGLILLTNDGDLMDAILRARNNHEKEYIVQVDKPIGDDILDAMRKGVPILDTITRPCEIYRISEKKYRIILTQGLNRQIRRMAEYFGYRVQKLKRIRIMNIRLENLKTGKWRELTREEIDGLRELTRGEKFYNEH
ncbi:MAG: pseudouridine synthase [Eubacterium sp.]|nr:pseudouridine synthase [Eubacterium sp.]